MANHTKFWGKKLTAVKLNVVLCLK